MPRIRHHYRVLSPLRVTPSADRLQATGNNPCKDDEDGLLVRCLGLAGTQKLGEQKAQSVVVVWVEVDIGGRGLGRR